MPSSAIGGAMLPHAPQFFSIPETEDSATIARVKEVAHEIGSRLKALKPDLWIIFAEDHAEQFFHNVAPAFTVHVGGSASGSFAGRPFHWRVPGETGFEIVRKLYRQDFDPAFTSAAKIDYAIGIPLTHLGVEDPVLPISVYACPPPQPTMERRYTFGEAMAHIVTGLGLRTVALVSGGMSHFPGTERYAEPDLAWDETALARLTASHLKSLIGYDEDELDRAGNLELRCWAAAAGMLGERKPDIVSMDPSWHHNYASLGWWGGPPAPAELPYPSDQAGTGRADRRAARDCPRGGASPGISRRPRGLCRTLPADPGSARCARRPRHKAIVAIGTHPLLSFLARMQVDRSGR
jgi:2,3-dihydroxyphenylpropionate 1,2-dioxygenase